MKKYINQIEAFWEEKDEILANKDSERYLAAKKIVKIAIDELDKGRERVALKIDRIWTLNHWVKKAILLYFLMHDNLQYNSGHFQWFDKIPAKFDDNWDEARFKKYNIRTVPGCYIRKGAFIGQNTILMPSFINIGAYIDDNCMVDTWATIGSCAQIGKNCHISGGTGIGGVLEPIGTKPVIIEDNCFIGARSEIAEGVIVGEGSVISMGVFIGASTKIIDRETGEISFGRIPPYSVVVPGTLPSKDSSKPSLYCAIIIKKVDESTRLKTSINELLRY